MADQEMTPVRADLFTDGDPPALLAGKCRQCSRRHFPLADGCPYCGSTAVERDEVPGRGRLWSWTAVTAPPPGYLGAVPYGLGVVELDAGFRVLSRLTEADPGRLRQGQTVHLVVDPLDDHVLTYAFAPEPEEGRAGEGTG